MTRAEFDHVERQARLLVPRARAGDDEALEALVMETRPALLSLIPAAARAQVAVDLLVRELQAALLEAAILWQPEREGFPVLVDRRLRRRLGDMFLRQRALLAAVEEVESDPTASAVPGGRRAVNGAAPDGAGG